MFAKLRSLAFIALILCGFAVAFQPSRIVGAQLSESTPVAEFEPTVALEWMQTLYDRVMAERVNPPAGARLYGYAGVTLYESLLNGMPGNVSLAGQIEHMPDMPLPDETLVYDWPSVSTGAMSTVLTALFPERPDSAAAFEALRDQQIEARGNEVDPKIVEQSIKYGDEIAHTVIEWIAGDNYVATRGLAYELPTGSDLLWVRTNDQVEQFPVVEPYWGQIRPFVLEWSDECMEPMNIEFSTEPGSTFYAQAEEVVQVGNDLTEEQQHIARFWVDTPGQTGTPAGHWVMIASQLADQLNLNLQATSEMYAMLNMTLADAFISCWSAKYQFNLLRPETYIQAYIRRTWAPYIQSPMFPEYPSGHSVVSGAAAEVLTDYFGNIAFTDSMPTRFGEAPREFTSFYAAAQEAAISRIYGGIHFRLAVENGLRQGRCVGLRVTERIRLRPLSQGE